MLFPAALVLLDLALSAAGSVVAVIASPKEKLFREELLPHRDKLPKKRSSVAYRTKVVNTDSEFTPMFEIHQCT